ncbi:hypothetical protein PRIPAC_81655, partial [Pristionchus pacificus]|uniref:Uncharacterized protein n=1 Tax=Pristionchus pacificus TaxID=54126 RepID=A0A2A6BY23_PRIPA
DDFSRLPDLILVEIAKELTRDALDCLKLVNRRMRKITQLPEIQRVKRTAELYTFQTIKAHVFCLQTTVLSYANGLVSRSIPRNFFYYFNRETNHVEKKETDNDNCQKNPWGNKTNKFREESIPNQFLPALEFLLRSHKLKGITIHGIKVDMQLMKLLESVDLTALEFLAIKNCPVDVHWTMEMCQKFQQTLQQMKLRRFDVFELLYPASFGKFVFTTQLSLKIIHLRTSCFYPSKDFIPVLGQFETIYMEGLVMEGDWALEAVRVTCPNIRMEINVRGRWLISISSLYTDHGFEEIIAKNFEVNDGQADRCFTNTRNKLKAECNVISGSLADLFYVHFYPQ